MVRPKKKAAPKVSMEQLLERSELSVPEAAQVLQISAPSVYRLIRLGELRHWRKSSGLTSQIVVYTDSVKDFIRNVQGRDLKELTGKKRRG